MLEIFQDIEDEGAQEARLPEEYEFDFRAHKLTGKKVSGKEALKVWCYFALAIERYRFRAFSWQYGFESEDIIGESYGRDFSESEIKRRITDALCVHPNISDISNFEITFSGSKIEIGCKIETDFGEIELTADETEVIYV